MEIENFKSEKLGALAQSTPESRLRRSSLALCYFLLLLVLASLWSSKIAFADDVPLSVSVQTFVKPEGNQLSVLLRVPMDALGEIDFPKRGVPGSLIFSEADPTLFTAVDTYILGNIRFYEDGRLLEQYEVRNVRVSLPGDRSFGSFEDALANIQSPILEDSVNLYWRQGLLDALITFPIESAESRFSVDSRLAILGVKTNTVIRYVLPSGAERPFNFVGNPGLVSLDPSWFQASWRFIVMGFHHILEGTDHILFLLCLVIPFRNIRALFPVITAFTVAHSITLISSLFGVVPSALWFPPLIETLIAVSIVYMAFENIIGFKQENRWLVTFGFGLIHGFGFSFLLTESMQFAGGHLLTALLSFNIGVEFGQMLVLCIVVPLLVLLFRYFVAERMGVIILSALVAHSAWHWMAERWTTLMAYDISLPVINRAFYASLTQWGILLIISIATLWVMQNLFGRFFAPSLAGAGKNSQV